MNVDTEKEKVFYENYDPADLQKLLILNIKL